MSWWWTTTRHCRCSRAPRWSRTASRWKRRPTGRRAWRRSPAAAPDIVLLDVNMPKADGFSVCGQIRQMPEGANTPVMMMTGAEDVDAIHKAYEVSATDFITKPLNWVLLGYRLRYVLRAARTRENLAVSEANLREQAVVLQARNAELDSFAWALSHDLKTPLVSLQGMAGLLVEECSDEIGEQAQHYVGRIAATVGEMGALLSNVLALSRIGREEGAIEKVSLDEVADLSIERHAATIRKRDVKVTRGELGEVRGLRVQLEQVFGHLVGNAVKYLGPVAEASIEIGRRADSGVVEYYVRDNGIGIDPAYHAKIFEPFQRLKELPVDGTGVGLTIVKKIVDGVDGRLRVESARGKGATFCFTWPQTS
ncbi:MAG: response regulator [Candidatus Rokubacteria bacterium]|nr:response regulator [Candidatus Rokubacteria bacterium]